MMVMSDDDDDRSGLFSALLFVSEGQLDDDWLICVFFIRLIT